MKNHVLFGLAFFCLGVSSWAQSHVPIVQAGTLKRIESFPSKYTDARPIDIWLPDGYTPAKKYAVLYMHDGGALFDSTVSLSRVAWEVEKTLTRLSKEGKIRDVIVVGIHNLGKDRHSEFWPQKPWETMPQNMQDAIRSGAGPQKARASFSDNYLTYIVKEVKPYMDSAFSTHKDRANTFIAGSSMGGLISWYAICEYPDVFGGAACLSTHWPGTFQNNELIPETFQQYLKEHLPDPATHRIYFDYGDKALDSIYKPHQQKVDALMKAKGYTAKNWETRYYPGEDHTERSWRKRLAIPMEFLLRKRIDKAVR
jgi:enterochelin esterase-like enzyme